MEHFWFEDAVIYHIYSLSLAQGPFINDYVFNGSGAAEISKWIPHIKGMGFNTVLLSPVMKSRSHGYDVTDYFTIDNRIGTNDEFRSLVKNFHDNGIKVLLDCVFNHCGRDFFAFRELQQGKREYASWFKGVDFGSQSPLGDPFIYETWSGYWELVKFSLDNPETKKYLLDAACFWIDDFGIDGMRLDAANVLDFNFMAELRGITSQKKRDFWLMGEVVGGDYTKWVNAAALHSVTNYILYKSLYSSHNDNNLYELASCVKNSAPDKGRPLFTFLDNHDQSRIASAASRPEYLNTLYCLLFTLPGIPSVYYGSEWGIKAVKGKTSDNELRPYIDITKSGEYSTALTGLINRLIKIRQAEKALRYGSYREIFIKFKRPFVFERSFEGERILIAVNIGSRSDTINIGESGKIIMRDLLTGEKFNSGRSIQIKPFSARILKAGK
ncbi:MAG: alpha-amylase family glycosyl hydrolase [Treponema sp.]|nr:alpha-amylase family glycosyl hydrolase [Treponema sp.]